MKQKKIIIASILGLVVLGLLFWGVSSNQENQSNQKDYNTVSNQPNSNNNNGTNNLSGNNANGSSAKSKKMQFPYTVEEDQIIIEGIYDYSGYYIEDGSEAEVNNVATIKIKNIADKPIEYAKILMNTNNGTLCFEISLLPAKESVIVMETNKQGYHFEESLVYENAQIAYMDQLDRLENKITVTENEKNGITIKNKTNETIPQLRFFYKNQMESGEYIGGIAYTVKLTDLKPGQKQTIYPSHFVSGSSKVMMIRVYE